MEQPVYRRRDRDKSIHIKVCDRLIFLNKNIQKGTLQFFLDKTDLLHYINDILENYEFVVLISIYTN